MSHNTSVQQVGMCQSCGVRPVWTDRAGVLSRYCSRTCRDTASQVHTVAMQSPSMPAQYAPQQRMCQQCGQLPVFVDRATGVPSQHCSRSCQRAAQQVFGGAQPPMPAQFGSGQQLYGPSPAATSVDTDSDDDEPVSAAAASNHGTQPLPRCQFLGCSNPVYVELDADGREVRRHDFCSMAHARGAGRAPRHSPSGGSCSVQ